ncbi:hypothetical protein TPHA_0M00750 [Tetrapisispora phaffii CBS 4417]|uniref:RNA helicase n=1 Tax=Tetrapisispora phaffii (strain ATCC 24235 / CBS 4417 / NBRC 1672 / NRRL Y-8282 / UCD 70-5) TaxID=1071381 RepID=G8C0D5_TETPH|nr:hypothetical protein TPHA_0M00750 [Tetrapisispora phaffii CBS 4417]CCE65650.1 hypothetical protein TPHA_0M00750 [Tetrapisispora phaffii CBS 4417]
MANRLLQKRLGKINGKKNPKKNPKKVQKNANVKSEGKVVKSTELKWKKVDIPDTLGDFGGLYGLEEIDGVDVKIINGQAQFITRTDTNIKKDDENQDDIQIDENTGIDDLVEFKNMDDIKEGELSAATSESEEEEEEEEDSDNNNEEDSDDNKKDNINVGDDALKTNVFTSDVNLDNEVSSIDLPEWTNVVGDLSFTTLNGLASLAFTKPTEIQMKAIPHALKGEDIMGKASTGSGKTLAYGIPILENLLRTAKVDANKPIALIFTPTRELAQQVTQHLQKISKLIIEKNPYSILSLTGGLSIQKQQRLLKYKGSGRVVVATPGRFLELLEKDNTLIDRFAKIDTLVLDEADRLLQDGHFDEFENILKHLNNANKKMEGTAKWQTMIFSATFSIDLFDKLASSNWKNKKLDENESEMNVVLKHLMNKIQFKSKPVIIDTNPEQKVSEQVKEALIECAPLERDLYSYYFISMFPGKTLIFCNAIDSVKKLHSFLTFLKISTFQLHSSMTQKNRLKNLEKYQFQSEKNEKLGKPTVLIASDVAARGLDIPDIQHVIHYHLPRTADVYIHRSGRTARGGKQGVSVMICSPEEAIGPLRKLRKMLDNKSQHSSKPFFKKWQNTVPLLPIDLDVLAQIRERSHCASELADNDIASTSLRKDDVWMKKAADELGIDFDSDDEIVDTFLAKNKTKKMNKTMERNDMRMTKIQLNNLLSKPIRKDMRRKYLTGGLVNLADNLVKKRGHKNIIGHDEVDALATVQNKKQKK